MKAAVFAIAALISAASLAETTVDAAHPHAYGANVGWVNARGDVASGAVIGYTYCTGYLWSANCGWIALGNGPANGWQYSNSTASDWGVNHDGQGRLAGHAYGANIGWITFEQTYGQPRIDLRTGALSGYAWGSNIGWIGLSNAQAYVQSSLAPAPDSDGDALPDDYEYRHAGNLTRLDGRNGADGDGDGVSDLEEAGADTDPFNDADYLTILSLAIAGQDNTLQWTARPTRFYRLQALSALSAGGVWEDAGGGLIGPPAASPAEATVTGVTQTSRFYRVQAVMPLSE